MGDQYHLFPSSFNDLTSHINFKLFIGLYLSALPFNQSKSDPASQYFHLGFHDVFRSTKREGAWWGRGGVEIMLKQKVTRTKTVAPLDWKICLVVNPGSYCFSNTCKIRHESLKKFNGCLRYLTVIEWRRVWYEIQIPCCFTIHLKYLEVLGINTRIAGLVIERISLVAELWYHSIQDSCNKNE